MNSIVKAHELRSKTKEELLDQLQELKKQLSNLRLQKTSSTNQKTSQIGSVRKGIARVLTVITQKQREAMRESFKDKKHLPLDMRSKKTRAMRRVLTADEKSRTTLRQRKQNAHFPQRKYAVRA